MNEEEREIVKKFERLYLKDFNNEKITNEDRLSYIECALITNLIEKLQKENEELKEENEYNKILLEQNNNFTIDKKTGNYKWNVIEIQKIKDKIEELNKEIKSCTEIDAIFKIKQEQILQELLESE